MNAAVQNFIRHYNCIFRAFAKLSWLINMFPNKFFVRLMQLWKNYIDQNSPFRSVIGVNCIRGIFLAIISFVFILHPVTAQQNPYEMKVGHPRIIMTKYDELALRFIMMEDPLAEKLKKELKKDADALLGSKNIKYGLDRRKTLLSTSREYLKRIITLSLAYRLFEDDKYSNKAINLMLFVCEYPDWNPQHFLDVAEMTAALAIGYDWNFYHLNLREKESIRNKIVEYGLKPGLEVYNNPDNKPHVWYKMNNNWNQVCAGGLILGALAVGEDFPDLKNNVIYQAIKNLVPTLDRYAPDGVWYEGPAYWNYANSYLAMTISSLQSALEHDFALSERPEIRKSSEYFVNTVSPTGKLFNFADAGSEDATASAALFWFSKKFGQKKVSAYCHQLFESYLTPSNPKFGKNKDRLFYLSLPWFGDVEPVMTGNPKAQYYRGEVELLFFQSTGNTLYFAAKGGRGTLNHQQLDVGTFVIDADGERWGIDLGSENYFLPDFFDNEVGGGRWQYYRNTNKSHSTLVIGDQNQYEDGVARFLEYKDNIKQPFGILDMTAVYPNASHVQRGYKMLNDDQILVRDEISFEGKRSSEVRWGMMTDASVELMGNKAVLTKNGKRFFLQAFSNEDVEFEFEAAKAYHKDAKDNAGKSLVFLKLNKTGNLTKADVSVVMGRNMNGLSDAIVKTKLENW